MRRLAHYTPPGWLPFCLVALIAVGFGIKVSLPQSDNLSDFGAFIAAARAEALGLNPYVLHWDILTDMRSAIDPNSPSLNAPLSLLLFRPLATVEPVAAFGTWYALSLALYALTALVLLWVYRRHVTPLHIAYTLGSVGFWYTLWLGQIYTVLLVVIVAAWLLLARQQYILAGLAIGVLIAIKPHFAVWAVLLFLASYRRAGLSAMLSAGVCASVPVVVYGLDIYRQWWAATQIYPNTGNLINASLSGVAVRFGAPWSGTMLSVVLFLLLAGWAWRSRPDAITVSAVSLVALILASPLGWFSCTIWLLPVFLSRPWAPTMRLGALMLLIPGVFVQLIPSVLPWAKPIAGMVYPLALAVVLLAILPPVSNIVWGSLVAPRPDPSLESDSAY